MLTGPLVKARVVKGVVRPYYLDPADPRWTAAAEQCVALFESAVGRTRDELEDAVEELAVGLPRPLVARGFGKLLTDRCEFETAADADPADIRRAVFEEAVRVGWHPEPAERPATGVEGLSADQRRERAIAAAGRRLGLGPAAVEAGLYGDLKGAQRVTGFDTLTGERLVHRYNVALAQAVLLKATRMRIAVAAESPARCRQLFRFLKFFRLMYEFAAPADGKGFTLVLDGPMSLFRQTTKYGVQMAQFLPALLLTPEWSLEADVRWGMPPRDLLFRLDASAGFRSHLPDTGQYVPEEVAAFASAFAGKVDDWTVSTEAEVIPLGRDGVCAPDLRFRHRATGATVRMELLGFWNKGSLARRLELHRQAGLTGMILGISAELQVDESDLAGLPATVYRFRSMPLVREVAELLRAWVRE
jgi:predicted nuclease of restriction endonuclease-like RecB superfamily